MRRNLITILFLMLVISGCTREDMFLRYALKSAGSNKSELKAVLKHYRSVDKDAEKLSAAKYLISNMPAHYSYRDTAAINDYYHVALEILGTGPSPDWQRDTLRQIGDSKYSNLLREVIPDVKIMKADYLIYSIDRAFREWRSREWCRHLSYNVFRDWILPYKVTELQSFDAWRDTLSVHYSDSLNTIPSTDFERNSIYGAIEIVRNEIHTKQSEIGHRIIWEDRGSIPMRSAATWVRMTYGSCMDYVNMGTAVFRSLGLPAVVDRVPAWGRNSDGHSWYVFLSDRGREEPTVNSLILPAGIQFYAYERIPKVWRRTYAINRDRVKYRNTAKYKHHFDLCEQDVTDHYTRTSDLEIETDRSIRLKDKYVYIAMAINSSGPQWKILDFGRLKRRKACFKNMGRNMLYIVLGYNGTELIPISRPFIVHKNGEVEYIDNNSQGSFISMDLRRKYYESYNVVDMRNRIIGGKFQCATTPDFSDSVTIYTIESTQIPDRIPLCAPTVCRYWRYLSPDGSWGSISELAYYDNEGTRLEGIGIANPQAGQDAIDRAFDGDLLSNFEINQPDDNWVGMEMRNPVQSLSVSISPRSDDNDICRGNDYELLFFDGNRWQSLGYQVAVGNYLHYDDIPVNTLLWIRNYTRGHDERPFLVNEDGEIEWW